MRQRDIGCSCDNRKDSRGNDSEQYTGESISDNVDEIVAVLSYGDITKRDEILWGYTYEECIPYLKIKSKQMLFIDLACGFFGYEDEELKLKAAKHEYAKVLKQAGKKVTKEILDSVKLPPKAVKKNG